MDDPFRSKLRVNPATNEWRYPTTADYVEISRCESYRRGRKGTGGTADALRHPNGNWWIGSMDTGVKAAGTDGRTARTVRTARTD